MQQVRDCEYTNCIRTTHDSLLPARADLFPKDKLRKLTAEEQELERKLQKESEMLQEIAAEPELPVQLPWFACWFARAPLTPPSRALLCQDDEDEPAEFEFKDEDRQQLELLEDTIAELSVINVLAHLPSVSLLLNRPLHVCVPALSGKRALEGGRAIEAGRRE